MSICIGKSIGLLSVLLCRGERSIFVNILKGDNYMEVNGLKEIKKGAKLLLKKEKIEQKLKELAKDYHNQVDIKAEDEKYFITMAKDYNKQKNVK